MNILFEDLPLEIIDYIIRFSFKIGYMNYSISILYYPILLTCKKFRKLKIKSEIIHNDYISSNELNYIM